MLLHDDPGRQFATAARVKRVCAVCEVGTARAETVPGKHARAFLSGNPVLARLELYGACSAEKSVIQDPER